MKRIEWTKEAFDGLDSLTAGDASVLLEKLELIAQFPKMYPERFRGRFSGLRYFMLRKRWIVYYRERTHALLIVDLVPALSRP